MILSWPRHLTHHPVPSHFEGAQSVFIHWLTHDIEIHTTQAGFLSKVLYKQNVVAKHSPNITIQIFQKPVSMLSYELIIGSQFKYCFLRGNFMDYPQPHLPPAPGLQPDSQHFTQLFVIRSVFPNRP